MRIARLVLLTACLLLLALFCFDRYLDMSKCERAGGVFVQQAVGVGGVCVKRIEIVPQMAPIKKQS